MKVLITGGGSQLAEMLVKTCPPDKHAVAASRQELDVTDADGVTRMFERRQFRLVINCAAYTAVDEAESQRDRAFDVNAAGAENIARAARQTGARMIQISTDFVFGGQRATPYRVDDEAAPVNIYGASKLAGEIRASDVH
ncbi:MAG TPA: sugar nucleotide-binding protein, partial [Gammaproteobacteria bacterium]|nr:sugar nucleotide-binding protein [Gammaproteobacteria bacterium]